MGDFRTFDFTVPIHYEGGKARVYVLWPCSALELRRFMMDKFAFDSGARDTWQGKCVMNHEVDAKSGRPTVVIALRTWELNADKLALLAHECFHAAEWMLMQSGHVSPAHIATEPWEAWEDMAYLLQRIMRRVLERLLI
jgi:hypothetical protein